MSKKASAPPAPDYGPLIAASTKASDQANALAQEQFDWAKQAYAHDSEISDKVASDFLSTLDETRDQANKDRARYENTFQPLEDDLVHDANTYDSDENRQRKMGEAEAGVAQNFEAARESAQRQLESYGVNPSATRAGALDIGIRTQQAAATAAAGNVASDKVDDTSRALRAQAIDIGRGLPAQVATEYGTGTIAGSQAASATQGATQTGAGAASTAANFLNAGNSALGVWGDALGNEYKAQMAAYNAKQSQSSGVGQALGLAAGIAKSFLFKRGGVVPTGFAEGGAVPVGSSPSRGAVTDDVPAALSPGEFVVPKEVVDWYGQKHFYGLIDKAEQDRGEAKGRTGAIPDVGVMARNGTRTSAVPIGAR